MGGVSSPASESRVLSRTRSSSLRARPPQDDPPGDPGPPPSPLDPSPTDSPSRRPLALAKPQPPGKRVKVSSKKDPPDEVGEPCSEAGGEGDSAAEPSGARPDPPICSICGLDSVGWPDVRELLGESGGCEAEMAVGPRLSSALWMK